MATYDQIKAALLKPQKNYAQAKIHAQQIDELLGFNCQPIEADLIQNPVPTAERSQQLWIGLDLQSLQTPYSELVQIIEVVSASPKYLWIDLGAGYGRMGIVLGFLNSEANFKGYEYVQERVVESIRIFRKWNLKNAFMTHADVADPNFEIEAAELYFIYDFGSRADIYHVLEKLRLIAKTKPIRVIARGRGIKNWLLIDFPWLSQMKAPIHFETFSLFQS